MFTLKRPSKTSTAFYAAVIALPLSVAALTAQSIKDHFYPKDTLVCQNGKREAHLYGDTIGWVKRSTLALFQSKASGERVYAGVFPVGLNDMRERPEDKLRMARAIANGYCQSGQVANLVHGF